jgi:hypothetical protein
VTLAVLAADLDYPRVRFSEHLELEGAAEWSRVLEHSPPLTPPEERRLLELLLAHAGVNLGPLPSWVCPELCATPSARERLRRWSAAGEQASSPDRIRARLAFVGDAEIRKLVVNALIERIPPPVVDHVLCCCWVLGVGWGANGWMSPAPPIPGTLPEPLRLLLVSGHSRDAEETASIFGHEVGHSWTLAPTDPETAAEPMAERRERDDVLTQLAVACGRLPEWIERDVRAERWAADCARAWGFKGPAANGEDCMRNRRIRRQHEADALPPFGVKESA